MLLPKSCCFENRNDLSVIPISKQHPNAHEPNPQTTAQINKKNRSKASVTPALKLFCSHSPSSRRGPQKRSWGRAISSAWRHPSSGPKRPVSVVARTREVEHSLKIELDAGEHTEHNEHDTSESCRLTVSFRAGSSDGI